MTPRAIAWREILHRRGHAIFFALAIGLGASLVVGIDALESGAQAALAAQGRTLAGGDVEARGEPEALDRLEAALAQAHPAAARARVVETLSMAVSARRGGESVAQVSVRAVSESWPIVGEVATGTGRPFHERIGPGRAVVAPRLLDDLGIAPGEKFLLGEIDLIAADTVARRPDISLSFFDFAPVIFITREDLDRARLVAPGSRSRDALYVTDLTDAQVRDLAPPDVRVESWRNDTPGVFRLLGNTLLFLRVLAFLVLAMGGVSAAAVLAAAMEDGRRTGAILSALGAPPSLPFRVWAWWIAIAGGAGVVSAAALGAIFAPVLASAFGDLLPDGVAAAVDPRSAARSLAAALALGILPAFVPLATRSGVPPAAILTDIPPAPSRRRLALLGLLLPPVLFASLAFLLEGWRPAALALGGGSALLASAWLVAAGIFLAARRALISLRGVVPRLAGRALARPGRGNHAAAVPLAVSLALLLATGLLATGLRSHFIDSAPPEAPNLFFVNVRPDQAESVRRAAGAPIRLHPMARGRVVAVNDRPAREIERGAREEGVARDRLTREFGFTFGDEVLPTDRIVEGPGLWDPAIAGPQVSVDARHRENFGVRRGDRITISILGVERTATVSSFREINTSARQPFFIYQFRPGFLEDVPHTWMGAARVPPGEAGRIAREVARIAPNATTIDMTEVAATAERVLERLVRVVGALGLVATGAGLALVLAGAWSSVRFRTRESVLYRTLGATGDRIAAIFAIEALVTGFVTALLAVLLAVPGVRTLFRERFEVAYEIPLAAVSTFAVLSILVVAFLTLLAALPALRVRPMEVLRHE